MAYDIGPKIGIDGEAEFRKAIGQINTNLKTLNTEMKAVASSFSAGEKSQASLTARNQVLNKQIDEQKNKLAQLKDGLAAATAKYGENDKVTQGWKQAVNMATAELNRMEGEVKDNTDAMSGMNKQAKADKLNGFAEGLKNVGAAAGKTLVAGLKAAGTAMAAVGVAAGAAAIKLGKEVIKQFGELEQNLGGSEAVFGKYAASIQKTGEDAYKNLGVSQSAYLATANKMGALFQGSGVTQQASLDLTTKAMQRAADMASVMGIDMQMALDSVAGAAKGNFTMMDNLGVAMNATNIEAYALAKGLKFTWKEATQSQKAEMAMRMFFENTEQYAGNFARESTQTVTGALGLLKAATSSFTAGLGNAGADMTNLTKNMTDAFKAVVDNIVPVLQNIVKALPPAFTAILAAVGDLLPAMLNTFVEMLPGITDIASSALTELVKTLVAVLPTLLPTLLSGAQDLISGVIKAITANVKPLADMAANLINSFVDFFIKDIGLIITAGVEIVIALAQGLSKSLPTLIPTIVKGLMDLLATLYNNMPLVVKAGIELIKGLVQGVMNAIPVLIDALPVVINSILAYFQTSLPEILQAGVDILQAVLAGITSALPMLMETISALVPQIIDTLLAMLPLIVDTGIQLLTALIEELPTIIKTIVEALPKIIENIVGALIDSIPQIIEAGIKLLVALIQDLPKIISTIVAALPQIIGGIVNGLISNIDKIILAGVQLLVALVENTPAIIAGLVGALPEIIGGLIEGIGGFVGQMADAGLNLIKGLWQGIKDAAVWLWNKVKGWCNDLIGKIKEFFGIKSPSTVFAGFGENMALGLGEGFGDAMKGVSKDMAKAVPKSFDVNAGVRGMAAAGSSTSNTYNFYSPKALGLRDTRIIMLAEQQRLALAR